VKFFIRTLLPLILMENEKIEKEHDFIVGIAAKENWNKNDISIIYEIAHKYRIIKKNRDLTTISDIEKDEIRYFLDHRIRAVPVPIALGQAALESGWGTSRFVFEGNNLFGHVAKDHKKGLKPKNWSGKQRNIKIFDSLQDSISAYMLNLNRNKAYRKFRALRREYPGNSLKIAEGFGNYAIIKGEYIERIKQVITKYGLYRLNDSKLGNGEKAIIHKKIKQIYIN
jgi:Bax protein